MTLCCELPDAVCFGLHSFFLVLRVRSDPRVQEDENMLVAVDA
jgi:hypothetical protein